MKLSDQELSEQIRASFAACRDLTRRAGSNFTLAFLLTPPEKRAAMNALYAFMRHSDDLSDEPAECRTPALALCAWREALTQVLADGQLPTTCLADDPVGRALLPAVAHVVHAFQIPPEHLFAVLDGVEMDLAPRSYRTFAELTTYCERVASAVGLACIHIWGFKSHEAGAPARSAGLAMQLTNILRDLAEDARQGRVYLPENDLVECNYTVEELRAGVVNRSFLRLMDLEIARAEQFYREGAELMRWLDRDGHRIFGLMMATYRELLRRIALRPGDVLTRRVRVSRPKKLWIAARWALLRPTMKP